MKNDIEVLEDLIKYTQDSINGYKDAATLVKKEDMNLYNMFNERAQKREGMVSLYKDLLRNKDPKNRRLTSEGTYSGDLHQTFMQFKALFLNNRKAALSEVERGESVLIKTYEDAEDNASAELKATIEKCLASIRENRNQVERIKEEA